MRRTAGLRCNRFFMAEVAAALCALMVCCPALAQEAKPDQPPATTTAPTAESQTDSPASEPKPADVSSQEPKSDAPVVVEPPKPGAAKKEDAKAEPAKQEPAKPAKASSESKSESTKSDAKQEAPKTDSGRRSDRRSAEAAPESKADERLDKIEKQLEEIGKFFADDEVCTARRSQR